VKSVDDERRREIDPAAIEWVMKLPQKKIVSSDRQ